MRPELVVAAFNLSVITSKTGQLIGFTLNDALDMTVLTHALRALPLVLGALWGGIVFRRHIQPEHYRKLLRFGLWVMAAALTWDTRVNI